MIKKIRNISDIFRIDSPNFFIIIKHVSYYTLYLRLNYVCIVSLKLRQPPRLTKTAAVVRMRQMRMLQPQRRKTQRFSNRLRRKK